MNNVFLNQLVEHKKWGIGKIISYNESSVTVSFEGIGEKDFQYPQAFLSFLRFLDEELQIQAVEAENKRISENEKKTSTTMPEEIQIKYRKSLLSIGDTFATHVETLNDCFGYDFSNYRKAYKEIQPGIGVWFPNIAKKVLGEYVSTDRTSGWINILSDGGKTILQVDNGEVQEREENTKHINLVFAKFDGRERYKFIGVFDSGKRVENGYQSSRLGTKFDTINMRIIE